jgi:hypothetical protein
MKNFVRERERERKGEGGRGREEEPPVTQMTTWRVLQVA